MKTIIIMKPVAAMVVLACALSAGAHAENKGPSYTGGLSNGRSWQALDKMAKISYVIGYREGVTATSRVATEATLGTTVRQVLAGSSLNNREMADALDRFYQNPLNRPLAISDAVYIVVRQATGGDPKEISKTIRQLRRETSGIPARAKPEKLQTTED
jgi:hypothetical protein